MQIQKDIPPDKRTKGHPVARKPTKTQVRRLSARAVSFDSNPKTDKVEPKEFPPPKHDWHRMWLWWLIAAVLVAVIGYLNPADVPVLLWKINLLTLAAAMGYWVDRSAFPYGRPDMLVNLGDDGDWKEGEGIVFVGAQIRRALIMASFIYATAVAV